MALLGSASSLTTHSPDKTKLANEKSFTKFKYPNAQQLLTETKSKVEHMKEPTPDEQDLINMLENINDGAKTKYYGVGGDKEKGLLLDCPYIFQEKDAGKGSKFYSLSHSHTVGDHYDMFL